MARARNIKPGFFRNAELVELPYETRLLFPGLWMLADREGRLEDRPKQIKMEIFPADTLDVELLLQQLEQAGLIERYSVDGKHYIQINNFTKHQQPHHREPPSVIPAKTDKPRASLGQDQGKGEASPSVAALNPDVLNPDVLTADVGALVPKPPARGTQLPNDFMPNQTAHDLAAESGADLQAELDQFRDYHIGKGSVQKDWQATFRTWLRNSKKFSPKARGSPSVADSRTAAANSFFRHEGGTDGRIIDITPRTIAE